MKTTKNGQRLVFFSLGFAVASWISYLITLTIYTI